MIASPAPLPDIRQQVSGTPSSMCAATNVTGLPVTSSVGGAGRGARTVVVAARSPGGAFGAGETVARPSGVRSSCGRCWVGEGSVADSAAMGSSPDPSSIHSPTAATSSITVSPATHGTHDAAAPCRWLSSTWRGRSCSLSGAGAAAGNVAVSPSRAAVASSA